MFSGESRVFDTFYHQTSSEQPKNVQAFFSLAQMTILFRAFCETGEYLPRYFIALAPITIYVHANLCLAAVLTPWVGWVGKDLQ